MAEDSDHESRDIILKRRRRFIISAAASISIAGCDKPQACLDVSEVPHPDAGATATPLPCLEVAPEVCLEVKRDEDAGADAGTTARPK